MIETKKITGTLFVISAPSGAGKTTLVHEVIARLKGEHDLRRVITYTSKQPRPGEVHGVDYHFLTEEEFKEKIACDFFVEHSTVYGAYYGFPRHVLHDMARGTSYMVIVDRAGAASLKAHIIDAVLIWIKPPDKEALAQRLAARAQDSSETIEFRLTIAQAELAVEAEQLFEYVIINDDLEMAIAQLQKLIKNVLAEDVD